MTPRLLSVPPLNLDSVSAQIDPRGALRIRGTISLRSPADTLRPFFREVHEAALADRRTELLVDIAELSFMNSSSIRVLITWLDWIVAEPKPQQYVLHFKTNPDATWQETTFSVLKSLGEDLVRISSA